MAPILLGQAAVALLLSAGARVSPVGPSRLAHIGMCDAEPAPDKTAELLETTGTAAAAAAAAMPETPPDKEWHGTSLVPKIDDKQPDPFGWASNSKTQPTSVSLAQKKYRKVSQPAAAAPPKSKGGTDDPFGWASESKMKAAAVKEAAALTKTPASKANSGIQPTQGAVSQGSKPSDDPFGWASTSKSPFIYNSKSRPMAADVIVDPPPKAKQAASGPAKAPTQLEAPPSGDLEERVAAARLAHENAIDKRALELAQTAIEEYFANVIDEAELNRRKTAAREQASAYFGDSEQLDSANVDYRAAKAARAEAEEAFADAEKKLAEATKEETVAIRRVEQALQAIRS